MWWVPKPKQLFDKPNDKSNDNSCHTGKLAKQRVPLVHRNQLVSEPEPGPGDFVTDADAWL